MTDTPHTDEMRKQETHNTWEDTHFYCDQWRLLATSFEKKCTRLEKERDVLLMQRDCNDHGEAAYWRGQDEGVCGAAERWREALEAPVPAPGIMNEPLESLYRRTEELRNERDALQAKLDAIMLEYCPDDMTEEQTKRWAENQKESSRRLESIGRVIARADSRTVAGGESITQKEITEIYGLATCGVSTRSTVGDPESGIVEIPKNPQWCPHGNCWAKIAGGGHLCGGVPAEPLKDERHGRESNFRICFDDVLEDEKILELQMTAAELKELAAVAHGLHAGSGLTDEKRSP